MSEKKTPVAAQIWIAFLIGTIVYSCATGASLKDVRGQVWKSVFHLGQKQESIPAKIENRVSIFEHERSSIPSLGLSHDLIQRSAEQEEIREILERKALLNGSRLTGGLESLDLSPRPFSILPSELLLKVDPQSMRSSFKGTIKLPLSESRKDSVAPAD